MTPTEVLLVDEEDRPLGTMEKLQAHQQARLHRAFSILVFNPQGQLLLQRRADQKYHSAGLWSNTCCSHPLPQEALSVTLHQRLQLEMGLDCPLHFLFSFLYRIDFANGLSEHEYDHVYAGVYDQPVVGINPQEASDYRWMDLAHLLQDLHEQPHRYTHWLVLICQKLLHDAKALAFLKNTLHLPGLEHLPDMPQ